jgi:glycosyltransferase involved in cell wall biosynthesis
MNPIETGVMASAPMTQSIKAERGRPDVWMVVPCFNEERRLDVEAFLRYMASRPSAGFIFVNDGSRDKTLGVLNTIRDRCREQVWVVDQQPNQGKAEAVRVGVLKALSNGAQYVGYFDADLATPLEAIDELVQTLDENPRIDIVMGTRVALLGRNIARNPMRHYSGRIFATAASIVVALPVYDTQCGAKLFRANSEVRRLFSERFGSRWIFDVEILARYLAGTGQSTGIYELPLKRWTDVGESKVRPADYVRAIGEMATIFRRYRLQGNGSRFLRMLSAPFSRYVSVGAMGTLVHYLTLIFAV